MWKEKKLFLLDMDGTLYLGNRLFDETKPFLDMLNKTGRTKAFLTNNSSKNVTDHVAKLGRLGIQSTEYEFVTSAQVTEQYLLTHHRDSLIYVFGTPSLLEGFRCVGLRVTDTLCDGIDVLVMGYDTTLTFKKLEDACILLGRGVTYIATNCDVVCPTEYGYVPDCGSVSEMLYNATGRRPLFLGKPKPDMLNFAMKKYGFSPEQTVIVGDRIYTDIESGLEAGVTTVLVLSGETDRETVDRSKRKPDFVMKDIGELCRAIEEEEA